MSDFWQTLFSSSEGNRNNLELRQIRKGGRPFLLLPKNRGAAATTLDLYPAQTARARATKSLLRFFIRIGLSIGAQPVSLSVSAKNDFVKFLTSQSGFQEDLPRFGVLAGNPAQDTRRFIILLFDSNQRPVAIVKAGFSEPAKALVEKEQQFLATLPASARGIPKLRASFVDHRVTAFSMDFAEGQSPRPDDDHELVSVLGSWLLPDKQIALYETDPWQRLESNPQFSQKYPALYRLRDCKIQTTIQHGDFAPWNIKAPQNGSWTVLDWERGTLKGIPGWDWFHFVIQNAILVARRPVIEIAQAIESLLLSGAFKFYSLPTGTADLDRELVIAYLIHLIEVVKPAEGLEQNRGLLRTLSERWLKESSSPFAQRTGLG